MFEPYRSVNHNSLSYFDGILTRFSDERDSDIGGSYKYFLLRKVKKINENLLSVFSRIVSYKRQLLAGWKVERSSEKMFEAYPRK